MEERQLFGVLTHHVRRALEIRRALAIREIERDAAMTGLARAGTAMLLVDSNGRILLANDPALALLRAGDGVLERQGRLSGSSDTATARLRTLIAAAVLTGRGASAQLDGALMLPRRTGPPLTALVTPLPESINHFGLSAPAALVLIRDHAGVVGSSDILRQLFQLTEREAELALALAAGRKVDEFAEASSISRNTAYTHLKNLMSKTGCRRQAELVSLVLASAAGLCAKGAD